VVIWTEQDEVVRAIVGRCCYRLDMGNLTLVQIATNRTRKMALCANVILDRVWNIRPLTIWFLGPRLRKVPSIAKEFICIVVNFTLDVLLRE